MLIKNKDKFIIVFFIIIFGILGIYKTHFANNKNIDDDSLIMIEKEENISQEENNNLEIFVHIDGEVNDPGIFKVKSSDRINDVLKIAGGATNNANLKDINLAKKVEDEMKIYIPSITDSEKNILNELSDTNSNKKVNINTADIETLKTLPGIGDTRAKEIISYRESHQFNKIEDIQNISGIGQKTYEKLKDLISVY